MAGVKNLAATVQLVTVAAAFWLIKGIAAATITVGGDAGWEEPSSSTLYADWASKNSFAVDDVLEFKWTGSHTVAEVTKDAYTSCDLNAKATALHESSPASITLTTAGDKYYICTINDHCKNGQKLAITVGVGGNSSSVPSRSSRTNGATSFHLGIFFVAFLFLVLGLPC